MQGKMPLVKKPLLVLCLLAFFFAGCRTLITEDYVLKHPRLKEQFLEMTATRAVDVVRHNFSYEDRTTVQYAPYNSCQLTSINTSGVEYVQSGRSGLYDGREIAPGRAEYKYQVWSHRSQLRFADVFGVKKCPHLSQLWLLDAKGKPTLHRFELGGFLGGQANQEVPFRKLSAKEIDELTAGLLFLCPNTRRNWKGLRGEEPTSHTSPPKTGQP